LFSVDFRGKLYLKFSSIFLFSTLPPLVNELSELNCT
jgi:hypothetical protein